VLVLIFEPLRVRPVPGSSHLHFKYDKVPHTLLTSFDIFGEDVGGVNECEIFL